MTTTPGRIVLSGLTKHFGSLRAVEDLSFTVEPGVVTGFLGPNGAGKTTTLRMLLGLVRPTAGTATIGGNRYQDLADPLHTVGAVLEASSFHPSRTARNHLRVLCVAAGIASRRADQVLELVSLDAAGDRPTGAFSLGMRQRLALAAALLGEPRVLVLDEPANGLDPEGIAWLRGFLRRYAAEGNTVLMSSHVLAEVAQAVDDVLVIARGRLMRQASLTELTADLVVRVRTPDAGRLQEALSSDTVSVERPESNLLLVSGMDMAAIGRVALEARVELHELTQERSHLEKAFFELTNEAGASS